jgi:hypothetical protein
LIDSKKGAILAVLESCGIEISGWDDYLIALISKGG